MAARSGPLVVLLSAPGTLEGIDPLLRASGFHLVRLTSVQPRALPSASWLARMGETPPPDTLVVTSRTAVALGVGRWRRSNPELPASLEVWAAGPGTAQALHTAGFRRVRRPKILGAAGLARSLSRRTPRTIAYLRSDLAGPGLARTLRGQGHRVLELVVYRLQTPPRFGLRAKRALFRADLLVLTSPSGVSGLRERLDPPSFERLCRTAHVVVLGKRSLREAHRQGFRNLSVAPSLTAQRFTQYVLRELRHARA
jgi:uroporphyrinogen-III synthase